MRKSLSKTDKTVERHKYLNKQCVIKSHETILSNSSTRLPINVNLWFLEISKAGRKSSNYQLTYLRSNYYISNKHTSKSKIV